MFDALACAFDDLQQLFCVLQLGWVKSLFGWEAIRHNLDACDDRVLKKFVCEDAVKEFSNVCI